MTPEVLPGGLEEAGLQQGSAPQVASKLWDATPPPLRGGEEEEEEEKGEGDGPPSARQVLSTEPLLQLLLCDPRGGAALRAPPPPPPLPPTDPPRAPPPTLGELQEELEAARRALEELRAQCPELGAPPSPRPPPLLALGVLGADLGAMATAFGVTELNPGGPGGGRRDPPQHPWGALAPPTQRGLRRLAQSLEAAARLQQTWAQSSQLEGGLRALESCLAALQHRHRLPSTHSSPGGAP